MPVKKLGFLFRSSKHLSPTKFIHSPCLPGKVYSQVLFPQKKCYILSFLIVEHQVPFLSFIDLSMIFAPSKFRLSFHFQQSLDDQQGFAPCASQYCKFKKNTENSTSFPKSSVISLRATRILQFFTLYNKKCINKKIQYFFKIGFFQTQEGLSQKKLQIAYSLHTSLNK